MKLFYMIGAGLWYFFGALIFLVLSPLIIVVVLAGKPYNAFWSRLRHDPKCNLEIYGLIDGAWNELNNVSDFVKAFERLSNKIAVKSKAKQGKLNCTGFDVLSEKPTNLDWTELEITQTLKTKHAEVELSLAFGACTSPDGQLYAGMSDGDDQNYSSWPPASARIIVPHLHTERHFTLWQMHSVWAVIGILRGQAKYTQPSGQLWVHIPEYSVWLVQYKINGDEYGLRNNFTNSFAQKYGRDKPFVHRPNS